MSSHSTSYHNIKGNICSKRDRESTRAMIPWGRNAIWRGGRFKEKGRESFLEVVPFVSS